MKKTEAPSKYFGYSTCTVSEAVGTASLPKIMWSIREHVPYMVISVKPEAL